MNIKYVKFIEKRLYLREKMETENKVMWDWSEWQNDRATGRPKIQ